MSFHFPWVLLLLLGIPFIEWLRFSKIRQLYFPYSSTAVLKKLPITWAVKLHKTLPLIHGVGLIFLIIAFAGPREILEYSKRNTDVVDIVMLVDVSTSMRAIDLSENNKEMNRLDSAKTVIEEFVKKRPQDRLGLIAFAALPYNLSPLTMDHDWLIAQMERLKTGMLEDGTAIGSAIASAVNRLTSSEATSKIIILLTDGSNNKGSITPAQAAKAAGALGIKIYTIGAGAKDFALVPVTGMFGGTRYVKRRVKIDEKTLKIIAEATGGEYFRATNLDDMKRVYDTVDKMERTQVKAESFYVFEEKYRIFAILALVLLMLEKILALGRAGRLP